MSRFLTALAAGAVAIALLPGSASGNTNHPTEPTVEVVATGLDNPRGLTVHGRAVFVAEGGNAGTTCSGPICFGTTGAITRISNGTQQRIITGLPSKGTAEGNAGGPNDVAITPFGQVLVAYDLGGAAPYTAAVPYGDRFGTAERLQPSSYRRLADLRAWEDEHDPDSVDPSAQGKESNPFSLVATWNGTKVVSDAAANDLIKIAPNGQVSTLAVFPSRCVPAPPGPPASPSCPPGQIRQQAVPTGVAIGPDGAFYVGTLGGFPFTPGSSRIWRVSRDGAMSVVADGLTTVIDIAFDRRGTLYALEYKKNGFFSPDLTGALVRIGRDGSHTEVLGTGLITPTGLAFGRDGAYIAHRSVPVAQGATPVAPHTGEVVKVRF